MEEREPVSGLPVSGLKAGLQKDLASGEEALEAAQEQGETERTAPSQKAASQRSSPRADDGTSPSVPLTPVPVDPALTAPVPAVAGAGAGDPQPVVPQAGASSPAAPPLNSPQPVSPLAQAQGQTLKEPASKWQAQDRENTRFFEGLPRVNTTFLLGGALLIGLALLRTVGPPVVASTLAAMHPYTAQGKQEICLSNLGRLGEAFALYSQDHDGRFPPLDYQEQKQQGQKQRVTWVSLLQKQGATPDSFTCPLQGVSDPALLSSYGLNPVLAAEAGQEELHPVKKSDLEHPDSLLLLADRGDRHDVALLPPFASWNTGSTVSTGNSEAGQLEASNLSSRHSDGAALLFADGHAGMQTSGTWLQEPVTWGGSLLFRRAASRIRSQHPLLAQMQQALDQGNGKAARRLLMSQQTQAVAAWQPVLALWHQNGAAAEAEKSRKVEAWGWQLAGLRQETGQEDWMTALIGELHTRSQQELGAVQGGGWQNHQSDWGFSLETPAGWSVEARDEGRYRKTYLHSGSPYISVLIEKGIRSSPAPATGVDWSAMTRDYERTYGSRYRLLELQPGQTLGSEAANGWRFELHRPDEPRLVKAYLGGFHSWDSYVLVCTAPAGEFKAWQPTFERMSKSFRFQ